MVGAKKERPRAMALPWHGCKTMDELRFTGMWRDVAGCGGMTGFGGSGCCGGATDEVGCMCRVANSERL